MLFKSIDKKIEDLGFTKVMKMNTEQNTKDTIRNMGIPKQFI